LEKKHIFEDPGHDDDPIGENTLPHEDKGVVSSTPFQAYDLCYASFDDLEAQEFSGKPLDLMKFSFNEEHDDHEIENVDYLLCIGRHTLDFSCF
jgi:hypothetical protein